IGEHVGPPFLRRRLLRVRPGSALKMIRTGAGLTFGMRRAEIVLSDALPYELLMLDIAARYTQNPQFKQLKKDEKLRDWLTHNATVEAFWTHARCLLEFFNRKKTTISMRVQRRQGISPPRIITLLMILRSCGVREDCQSKSMSRLVTSAS